MLFRSSFSDIAFETVPLPDAAGPSIAITILLKALTSENWLQFQPLNFQRLEMK